jgi:hypothetical protein
VENKGKLIQLEYFDSVMVDSVVPQSSVRGLTLFLTIKFNDLPFNVD